MGLQRKPKSLGALLDGAFVPLCLWGCCKPESKPLIFHGGLEFGARLSLADGLGHLRPGSWAAHGELGLLASPRRHGKKTSLLSCGFCGVASLVLQNNLTVVFEVLKGHRSKGNQACFEMLRSFIRQTRIGCLSLRKAP